MRCPRCGYEIRGRALFCPNCGYRLEQDAQAPRQQPSAEPLAAMEEKPKRRGCSLSLAVLLIAGLVMVLIAGLGVAAVYYGLADRAKVERQAAEEHYQKGLTHLEKGELELAIAEFEVALQLNPKLKQAEAKLLEAKQKLAARPTATPMLQKETKAAYLEKLRQAHQQGDWAEVFDIADRLLALDPTYHRDEVDQILFDAFYQDGLQLVEQDRMKEAVRLFDRALALQPDNTQVAHSKHLATLYMTAMGYWGADWAKAIENLETLYRLAPKYKDVLQRLYGAHLNYGDDLAKEGKWCEAAEEYGKAIKLMPDTPPELASKHQQALARCKEAPTIPSKGATRQPQATPGPTVPSGTFYGRLVERRPLKEGQMFIRGKVLDKNGKGIPGVRVKIQAWDWSAVAVTDGEGQYAFDGLGNPVTYTLSLPDLPCLPFEVLGVWGKLTWVDFQQAK